MNANTTTLVGIVNHSVECEILLTLRWYADALAIVFRPILIWWARLWGQAAITVSGVPVLTCWASLRNAFTRAGFEVEEVRDVGRVLN